jgi:hypothetical protein
MEGLLRKFRANSAREEDGADFLTAWPNIRNPREIEEQMMSGYGFHPSPCEGRVTLVP